MRLLTFLTALPTFLLTAFLILSSPAFAQTGVPVNTTITVDNIDASAFVLTDATGETIGEIGVENTAWTLQVGQRYRIINNGELLFHPFELRDDDGVLLAQGDGEGTFEGDADVDFVSDDEGITFTLTSELSEVLTSYRCAYHPVMTGSITLENAL